MLRGFWHGRMIVLGHIKNGKSIDKNMGLRVISYPSYPSYPSYHSYQKHASPNAVVSVATNAAVVVLLRININIDVVKNAAQMVSAPPLAIPPAWAAIIQGKSVVGARGGLERSSQGRSGSRARPKQHR